MEAPKRKLNPLVAAAAVVVLVLAGVAVAAVTGVLPGTGGSPAPEAGAQEAPTQAAKVKNRIARAVTRCKDCGVVLGVLQISEKGDGTGIGAVAGGVGGAVVGNQFGDDSEERLIGRVVGAVGGALAGNEIERQAKRTKRWDVNVRMDDGSQKMMSFNEQPEWKAGDKVRVVDGRIVSRPG